MHEKMDCSFISVGGVAKLAETRDLLDDASNTFLEFSDNEGRCSIKDKITGAYLATDGKEKGFDYGLIIKIHPRNNRRRTWICCAGIGEWGTSGAGWYLSNKWAELQKIVKNKEFYVVTKTRIGADETTSVISVRCSNI